LLAGIAVLLLLLPPPGPTLAELVRGDLPHRQVRPRPVPLRRRREAVLDRRLAQAGIPMRGAAFRALCIAAGALIAAAGALAGLPIPALLPLPLATLLLGTAIVTVRAGRACGRMEAALVGALPSLVASLRAGMGIELALAELASRAASPLREELEAVLSQVRLGLVLPQALEEMAARWPLPPVRTLAVAVALQRETGGALAEVLQVAEEGIRSRHELLGEVRSLTAQQRLTAYLLLGLPFAVMGGVSLFSPDYASRLFLTGAGRLMLAGAVFLQAVGYFFMRSFMKVEVYGG